MKKIEEYFAKFNGVDVIFDPIPSYDGDWNFGVKNLEKNALIDPDTKENLFDKFIFKTYIEPLSKLFKSATNTIIKFDINLVSTPKLDRTEGRTLHYSKSVFFKSLLSFFNQNLDKGRRSDEEHYKYLINLYNNIEKGNDALILAYSNAVKEKLNKIKDLQQNELNSIYYESAFLDYENQNKITKSNISFKEYLNNLERIFSDLFKGITLLDDFFKQDLDTLELAKCFDPDTFYLLFAKIIYEFNLNMEKQYNCLYDNFAYLMHYQDALEEIVKEDKKYAPHIRDFVNRDKKNIHSYNRWLFKEELNEMLKRHPHIKRIPFPLDKESGKNIDLVNKLYEIYNSEEMKLNWDVLPKGDGNKRKGVTKCTKNDIPSIEDKDLVNEVNMRIDIMDNSGYLGYPIPGLNSFAGYFAYIYPNGIVILEKYWANDNFKPAKENATYVMNIDNFVEKSKWSKTSLMEYIKLVDSYDVKRIFHDGINRWQENIYSEIHKETNYNYEDAIDFINKLQREALKDDERSI